MEESIIKCSNLTHYYGKRRIYEKLSFEVPKGRILGLLGKNGTGKTTTINILMGYLKPRSGVCKIFNEDIQLMSPETRSRIALLLEGHVQYSFMNIEQIEKYYSAFYSKWNKEAYYELMKKLKVAPKQRISQMSCGQRSQVALGLILAQNAELLVLDDFSLGLDPGYRRLFTEYLHEYAKAENKTIFITSHIIQDMERLVDDCIIMDYGKIIVQKPVKELLSTLHKFSFTSNSTNSISIENENLYNTETIGNKYETYSFLNTDDVKGILNSYNILYSDFKVDNMNLEDAFIGLTGKY